MEFLVALWLLMMSVPSEVVPVPPGVPAMKAVTEQLAAAAEAVRHDHYIAQSGTPLLTKRDPQPDTPPIKGLYATAYSAGGSRLEQLLALIDHTDLNSLVIDVKDDRGYITYLSDNPELQALGTFERAIPDMQALMERLKQHNVYPIARVVVFKDTFLAKKRPDLSFVHPDGTVWDNGKKDSFVNPYRKEIWEYNLIVAKEAAKLGFKEIQLDYVRFPEGFETIAEQVGYTRDERKRIDVVADFVKYAKEELEPLGVRVSVDIFGYAASVPAAEGIGQDFEKISANVDVISPMIYPSHYGPGWYGARVPDAKPYEVIRGATLDTIKKLESLGERKPIIRPWIQDFTASWIPGYIRYGVRELEEQIRALNELGVHEYLLWNAGNQYTPGVTYR